MSIVQGPNAVSKLMLLGLIVGLTGCSGLNRMETQMDSAAAKIEEPGKPEYEGKVQAVRRIGAMTSLEFADGSFYDVEEAPRALVQGDTVRIYKTDEGYEALVWKAKEDGPILATSNPT